MKRNYMYQETSIQECHTKTDESPIFKKTSKGSVVMEREAHPHSDTSFGGTTESGEDKSEDEDRCCELQLEEDCEGAVTTGVVRGVRPVDIDIGVRPVPFVTGVRPVPPSIIDSKLSPRSPAEGVSMGTPRSATVELRRAKVPTFRLVGLRGLFGDGAALKTPTTLSS